MPARIMGIVNVTPDSFSDGGEFLDPERAIAHGRTLADEGADLLDIGGESTRPGSEGVTAEEEVARVAPVVEALVGVDGATVSIDTSKVAVAESALSLGATIVNDVTALRAEPDLAAVCAERRCEVVLMHMLGEPRTMQAAPSYDDVVSEVVAFLEERLAFAVREGIPEELICLDPGIGFGKTPDQNLELVRRLDALLELGRPVVVGLSRKSTLGKVLGDPDARVGSTPASVGGAVAAFERGAWMLRAHDVRETVEALAVAAAVERGRVAP